MSPEIQIYLRLIHTLKPDVFETYVQCKHFQPKTSKITRHVNLQQYAALTRHGPGDLLEMIHLRQLSTTDGSNFDSHGTFSGIFPITNLPQKNIRKHEPCMLVNIPFLSHGSYTWDCLIVFFFSVKPMIAPVKSGRSGLKEFRSQLMHGEIRVQKS